MNGCCICWFGSTPTGATLKPEATEVDAPQYAGPIQGVSSLDMIGAQSMSAGFSMFLMQSPSEAGRTRPDMQMQIQPRITGSSIDLIGARCLDADFPVLWMRPPFNIMDAPQYKVRCVVMLPESCSCLCQGTVIADRLLNQSFMTYIICALNEVLLRSLPGSNPPTCSVTTGR